DLGRADRWRADGDRDRWRPVVDYAIYLVASCSAGVGFVSDGLFRWTGDVLDQTRSRCQRLWCHDRRPRWDHGPDGLPEFRRASIFPLGPVLLYHLVLHPTTFANDAVPTVPIEQTFPHLATVPLRT